MDGEPEQTGAGDGSSGGGYGGGVEDSGGGGGGRQVQSHEEEGAGGGGRRHSMGIWRHARADVGPRGDALRFKSLRMPCDGRRALEQAGQNASEAQEPPALLLHHTRNICAVQKAVPTVPTVLPPTPTYTALTDMHVAHALPAH